MPRCNIYHLVPVHSVNMNSQACDVITDTTPKWDDDLLELLAEYQNNNHQVNTGEVVLNKCPENVQQFEYQNTMEMEYTVNQMGDFINFPESTTLLSPSWDDQHVVNQITNMSTYFSSFNPTTQIQAEVQQYPVTNPVHQRQTQQQSRYSQFMEKSHFARINAAASSGVLKKSLKKKRKRTVFTTEQVEALELVFAKKPYITREDRQILVQQLQLSDKSVKIWFQNRRLKGKREDSDTTCNEDVYESGSSRLDYVESKINERTNEFGYVTLDDKIMGDLVNIIEDYLNKTPSLDSSETKMEAVNPIYEPISPASMTEGCSSEENFELIHFRNTLNSENESIQRLLDIESIITV